MIVIISHHTIWAKDPTYNTLQVLTFKEMIMQSFEHLLMLDILIN
jgi:hypothetical protein